MKFGPVRTGSAGGAILAHALGQGTMRFRKGHVLSASDVDALTASGIETVIVAQLDLNDLGENEAATAIAAALHAPGLRSRPAATGRVNIHAEAAGVFTVDKALVDAMNAIDPDVTLATLPNHASVRAGQMVATVKIIPFAVPQAVVDQVCATITGQAMLALSAFRPARVALIQTELPSLKPSILDKTTEVTRARLVRSGSTIVAEHRVPHRAAPLAATIAQASEEADLVLIFGASAVSDGQDVIPSAIRSARGVVRRVGMPVDPGNLLVLGELNGVPVIGAPGCARSPKENGFDWVLDRLLAGIDVTSDDIAGMGVGGLLTEIGTRPAPRERPQRSAGEADETMEVHALVLAAGRSSRMGGPNKLLARFAGVPLIRQIVERVAQSSVAQTLAVVGHQAEAVEAALAGLPVRIVHNPAYAEGLSGSLKVGVAALPPSASGLLVALGDMPRVTTPDLERLLAAFRGAGSEAIVRATHAGKRGNPVILPRASFAMLDDIEGDTGARAIMESGIFETVDVELGAAASLDVDTPEAMQAAGGELTP